MSSFIGRVRRNHALEHATVSLLLARLGPELRLVGRATGDGFFIYGNIPTDALSECAMEGLARMKRGEAFWAVTPLCGTNLAAAGILATLSTMAVLGNGDRRDRLPNAILAGIVGVTVGQPVGRLLQKHFTTCADVADMQIVGIEAKGGTHKVRTKMAAAAA